MSAKLSFQDIYNNELGTDKLNFGSFTVSLSVAAGVPTADSSVGALYVDSASGSVYRKTASGGSNWTQIGSITTTIFINKFPTIQVNSAVTSTDNTSGPSIGDLVGIYGVGAFAASGAIATARAMAPALGSVQAGMVMGGVVGAPVNSTEIFNGAVWAAGATMLVSINAEAATGSQNAALVVGGAETGLTMRSDTELFNGTSWVANGGTLALRDNFFSAVGSVQAALVAGGHSTVASPFSATSLFNGSIWTVGNGMSLSKFGAATFGAQNAAVVTAGGTLTVITTQTEMFNGSAWSFGTYSNTPRNYTHGAGSQNAGIMAGGSTATGGTPAPMNGCEIFNGTAWLASGNLLQSRTDPGIAGGQNAGLVVGGYTNGFSGVQQTSEIHTQSTYRKLFSKEYNGAKNIGILLNSNTILLQGSTITSTFYVANKYLVTNRFSNSQLTNNTALTSVTFASVTGPSSNIMTYNLSTTANMLSLIPGMQVVVATGGANPVDATNIGTFVINRIINPTSIEVINSTGTTQNPGTGTLSFLTSMIAVDNISPGDIIVGKTDVNGILTIHKPIVVSSLNRRIK